MEHALSSLRIVVTSLGMLALIFDLIWARWLRFEVTRGACLPACNLAQVQGCTLMCDCHVVLMCTDAGQ